MIKIHEKLTFKQTILHLILIQILTPREDFSLAGGVIWFERLHLDILWPLVGARRQRINSLRHCAFLINDSAIIKKNKSHEINDLNV